MRNRQVLLLLLEYIVTSECLKGIRTGFNLHQYDKRDPWPPATKNIIAYVDDIVVMSMNEEDYIIDLKETFANLREARLKLNP
jgi:hypothetical protein